MHWPDEWRMSYLEFTIKVIFLCMPIFEGVFLIYIDFGGESRYTSVFWGDIFGIPWYLMGLFFDAYSRPIGALGIFIFPFILMFAIYYIFCFFYLSKNKTTKFIFWTAFLLSMSSIVPVSVLQSYHWWLIPHYAIFASYR